ncbi:MAG: transpeptidase family protein [bacterium]|nr:MAG: transpeptidase family protein [bacterium]
MRWNSRAHLRLRLLGVVLPALLLLPLGRAFYLQVLDRAELKELAVRQNRMVVKVQPRRGPIVDRNGQPLAISVPVPSVYAVREEIQEKGKTALLLSQALGMKKGVLLNKLGNGNGFVWLKRRVAPEEAEKVADLDLPGVGVQEESRRYYPNLELAASVLGFVGVDKGLEGIECSLEDQLKGGSSTRVLKRDAKGWAYTPLDFWDSSPTVGATVQLTLDRSIQFFAEQALNAAGQKLGAKSGSAIVMETETGRILAIASYPPFNPNEFSRYRQENFRNQASSFIFEPGSTFKVITIASALEEGIFDEKDIFFCGNGSYRVADATINDNLPYGWLTLKGILQKSSNIGATKVGLELGRERFEEYARRFGLGEKTGILLPGEGRGMLRKASSWTQVDTAAASFGQGIGVTALQMVNAVNAIANGGLLMRPYLVEKIVSSSGEIIQMRRPQEIRRAISPETAVKITRMMESVVGPEGSGYRARVPGYETAGKTGTAQKFSSKQNGYSESSFVASFVGFAPSRSPVLTVLVVIDEPKENTYGGVVAAPVWAEIVGKTLNYLQIEPGASEPGRPDAPLPKGTRVAGRPDVKNAGAPMSMPDLKGLTLREALGVLADMECGVKIEGTGVVVRQSPEPGEGVAPVVRIGLMPRIRT